MISALTACQLSLSSFDEHKAAKNALRVVQLDRLIKAAVARGEMHVRVEYEDYNDAELHSGLKKLGYKLIDNVQKRGQPRTLALWWDHLIVEVANG